MPKDFRAKQIRAAQIITSGGVATAGMTTPKGTGAALPGLGLAVYSSSVASDFSGGISDTNMFKTVGSDVYLFVSGTKTEDGHDASYREHVALFGGDIVVSGTLWADRMVVEVTADSSGDLLLTGSLQIRPDSNNDHTFWTREVDGSTLMIASTEDARVGIGNNTSPAATLDVTSHTEQLRLSYDSGDYASFTVGSDGDLLVTTTDGDGAAGDLEFDIDGDIILDADGGQVTIKDAGANHFLFDCDNTAFTIYDDASAGDDWARITVADNGATTIATNDVDGTSGNLTLDADGNIELNADGGDLHVKDASAFGWIYSMNSALKRSTATQYNPSETGDTFQIYVGENGETSLGTTDSSGNRGANLTLAPSGTITVIDGGVSQIIPDSLTYKDKLAAFTIVGTRNAIGGSTNRPGHPSNYHLYLKSSYNHDTGDSVGLAFGARHLGASTVYMVSGADVGSYSPHGQGTLRFFVKSGSANNQGQMRQAMEFHPAINDAGTGDCDNPGVNVGIGTEDGLRPKYALHVVTASRHGGTAITNNQAKVGAAIGITSIGNVAQGGQLVFEKARGNTMDASAVEAADAHYIKFSFDDGAGTQEVRAAVIAYANPVGSLDIGSGKVPASLHFSTTMTTESGAKDSLIIWPDGRVTIGSNIASGQAARQGEAEKFAPAAAVDVYRTGDGSSGAPAGIMITPDDDIGTLGTSGSIAFRGNSSDSTKAAIVYESGPAAPRRRFVLVSSASASDIVLKLSDNDGVHRDVMTLDAETSRVGIMASPPTANLHVGDGSRNETILLSIPSHSENVGYSGSIAFQEGNGVTKAALVYDSKSESIELVNSASADIKLKTRDRAVIWGYADSHLVGINMPGGTGADEPEHEVHISGTDYLNTVRLDNHRAATNSDTVGSQIELYYKNPNKTAAGSDYTATAYMQLGLITGSSSTGTKYSRFEVKGDGGNNVFLNSYVYDRINAVYRNIPFHITENQRTGGIAQIPVFSVVSGSGLGYYQEDHKNTGAGTQVLILSGNRHYGQGASDPDPQKWTDTNFFVSGTAGSKNTTNRATAVFGGDMVISGALYVSTPGVGQDVTFYGEDSSAIGLQWDADSGNHGKLTLGQDDHGVDFQVYGEDSNNYVNWQQATNTLSLYAPQGAINTKGNVVFDVSSQGWDFTVNTNNKKAIFVDGSEDQVLILSGGGVTSYDEARGSDVNFYVSGTVGSKDSTTKGTAVFGGDVVISGTLHGGSPLKVGTDVRLDATAGASQYLNFGATDGSGGYGIRSNAGTMEFKTNGGGWAAMGSGGGGIVNAGADLGWFAPGSGLITTTGSVGIGLGNSSTKPAAGLHIGYGPGDPTDATVLINVGNTATASGSVAFQVNNAGTSGALVYENGSGNIALVNSGSNKDVTIKASDGGIEFTAINVDGSAGSVGILVPEGETVGSNLMVSGSSVQNQITLKSNQQVGSQGSLEWDLDSKVAPSGMHSTHYYRSEIAAHTGSSGGYSTDWYIDNETDGTASGILWTGYRSQSGVTSNVPIHLTTRAGNYNLPAVSIVSGSGKSYQKNNHYGAQVLILSGAGFREDGTANDPQKYQDTNFFVSGTRGSRGTAIRGTSVFGGDVIASGSIFASGSIVLTNATANEVSRHSVGTGTAVVSADYSTAIDTFAVSDFMTAKYLISGKPDNTTDRFVSEIMIVCDGDITRNSAPVFTETRAYVDYDRKTGSATGYLDSNRLPISVTQAAGQCTVSIKGTNEFLAGCRASPGDEENVEIRFEKTTLKT